MNNIVTDMLSKDLGRFSGVVIGYFLNDNGNVRIEKQVNGKTMSKCLVQLGNHEGDFLQRFGYSVWRVLVNA